MKKTETMLEFEKTVERVLDELKNHTGLAPELSIDYANEKLYIKKSCSSFLKRLLLHEGIIVHLSQKGLSVEYIVEY